MNTYHIRRFEDRWKYGLFGIALIALILVVLNMKLPWAYDWQFYWDAFRRVIAGKGLYTEGTGFMNAPWMLVLIAPFGLFSYDVSRALFVLTLIGVGTFLAKKSGMSVLKTAAFLLSPPLICSYQQGQMDLLLLSTIFLPQEVQALAAFAKPQSISGILFTIDKKKYISVAIVLMSVLLLSFLVFGFWPMEYLAQEFPKAGGWNYWRLLWPYNVLIAVALCAFGWKHNNKYLYIAASPFFFPYAATQSFTAPVYSAAMLLEDKWFVLLVVLYWSFLLIF